MLEALLDSLTPWSAAFAISLVVMAAAALGFTDIAGRTWSPPDIGGLRRMRNPVMAASMTAQRLRMVTMGGTVGLVGLMALVLGLGGHSSMQQSTMAYVTRIQTLERQLQQANAQRERALQALQRDHEEEIAELRREHEQDLEEQQTMSQTQAQVQMLQAQGQVRELQFRVQQQDEQIQELLDELTACGCAPGSGGLTPAPGTRPNFNTQ